MVFNTRKRKKSRLNSTQKKQKGGGIEWFEKMLKEAKALCFTEKKKQRDRDNSWFYTTKKLLKGKEKIEAANHFHVFTRDTAKFPHGSRAEITIVNPSIITNSQLITAITGLTNYLSSVHEKSADQGLRAILKFYCDINPSDEISNELTQAKENAKSTINDNTNDVPCKTPPIITARASVTMATPVSSERNVSEVDDAVKIFNSMNVSDGSVPSGLGGSANFIRQGRELLVNIFKNYHPNCHEGEQKNQEKQLCTDGQSFFEKLNNCPNFSTNPEDYISFVENIKKGAKGEFIKKNKFKGVKTIVALTESVEEEAKKQKKIKFRQLKKFIINREYFNNINGFDVKNLKLGVDVDLKKLNDILELIKTFQVTNEIRALIQKIIDLINEEEKKYGNNFLNWKKKNWSEYFNTDSDDSSNDSSNDSDDDDDICESERKKSDEEERDCKIIELRDLLIHILDDETVKEGMIAIRGSFSRGGGTRKRGKRKKIKRRVKTRRKRQRKQINTRKKRGRRYTRKY